MSALNIVLLIITCFLLLVTAILTIYGYNYIKSYTSDTDLISAKYYLTGAWITSLLGLFFVLILLIASIFAPKFKEISKNLLIFICLGFSLILIVIVGVLSGLASSKIDSSVNLSSVTNAYHYSILAAVLSIIGFVLILGVLIFDISRNSCSSNETELPEIEKTTL